MGWFNGFLSNFKTYFTKVDAFCMVATLYPFSLGSRQSSIGAHKLSMQYSECRSSLLSPVGRYCVCILGQ